MTAKLTNSIAEAEAEGFATFNEGPHLCVDVPDGMFTISARTSDGKMVTMCFVCYKDGGTAQCVDIKRHDGPTTPFNGEDARVFDMLLFKGGGHLFDTRDVETEKKPMIATILMQD